MPTPRKGNVSFQITIQKETKENLEAMVEAMNELHDPQIGHVTLSNFIERILIDFIIGVHNEQEGKNPNKGEKGNA